jgi:hypothetical protein
MTWWSFTTCAARLEGMWWEAKGAWQQAESLYSDLLADNPSDSVRLLLPSLTVCVPFGWCFSVVSVPLTLSGCFFLLLSLFSLWLVFFCGFSPSDSVRLLLPSLKASLPFVQCFCVVSEAKKGRQTVKEDEFFRVLQ